MKDGRHLPACGRVCWLCLLALEPRPATSAARDAALRAAEESVALLQGQVQLHGESSPLLPRPGFERTLVRNSLGAIDAYLNEYSATRSANMMQASAMRGFVGKYLSGLKAFFNQKRHEVKHQEGMPLDALVSGVLNLTDAELATKTLEMLRNKKFVDSLERGLKNVHQKVMAFSLRLEKKITELKETARESKSSEIPLLVSTFIQRQEHIAKSTLKELVKVLDGIVMSMPQEYHRFAHVSEQVLGRLADVAASRFSEGHWQVFGPRGTDLCSEYRRLSRGLKQMAPLLSQVLTTLPRIETFASSEAPDVAPAAKNLASKIASSSKTLGARLDQDLSVALETVCHLVPGAESPQL